MTVPKIICKYSCHLCGLKSVEVDVPARTTEDILDWMRMLGERLSADHRARSPRCRTASLADVMIPITGANKVGGPMLS